MLKKILSIELAKKLLEIIIYYSQILYIIRSKNSFTNPTVFFLQKKKIKKIKIN